MHKIPSSGHALWAQARRIKNTCDLPVGVWAFDSFRRACGRRSSHRRAVIYFWIGSLVKHFSNWAYPRVDMPYWQHRKRLVFSHAVRRLGIFCIHAVGCLFVCKPQGESYVSTEYPLCSYGLEDRRTFSHRVGYVWSNHC